jgi:hypothetical protein
LLDPIKKHGISSILDEIHHIIQSPCQRGYVLAVKRRQEAAVQLFYDLMSNVVALVLKLSDSSYLLGNIRIIIKEVVEFLGGCRYISYASFEEVKEFRLSRYYGKSRQNTPL